jgi:hypothetical protein
MRLRRGGERDLARAIDTSEEIGDRRWPARTLVSIGGLRRLRREWAEARQRLDAAVDTFRVIGDQPVEARAPRRRHPPARLGELADFGQALDASEEIFPAHVAAHVHCNAHALGRLLLR